ncbi:hypothetical protein C8Q79DRAFT_945463 [Trametes meyenii]|nr:hypothetical protein C8Q79DRAFT_945463 [Trametes meyenii]
MLTPTVCWVVTFTLVCHPAATTEPTFGGTMRRKRPEGTIYIALQPQYRNMASVAMYVRHQCQQFNEAKVVRA